MSEMSMVLARVLDSRCSQERLKKQQQIVMADVRKTLQRHAPLIAKSQHVVSMVQRSKVWQWHKDHVFQT